MTIFICINKIKMEIVNKNIKELIEAEYNPRILTNDQYQHLKDSLQRFGVVDPVLVNVNKDRKNIIIGGHQRTKVWRDLGNDSIPCVELDLTLEQEKELNIRLNKNTGAFDFDALANYFEEEDLIEWGFNENEFGFDNIIEEVNDDNYNIDESANNVDVVEGDFIEIGEHKLYCGSSLLTESWEKLLNGKEIDLVVTDPPYNVAYKGKTKDSLTIENDSMGCNDFYQFLYDFYTATNSYVKKGGGWYVWHADSEGANFRKAMTDAGILLKQCLIWVKNSMVMGRQDYHWKHEPCLYGWKDGASHNWYTDRKQTTVLEFDRPSRNAEHPTMKPISLIAYQISNSSKKGELIADGFLGSGTTMLASHELGRECVGCEIDPKYCQVIIERMHNSFPELEIKINGIKYIINE